MFYFDDNNYGWTEQSRLTTQTNTEEQDYYKDYFNKVSKTLDRLFQPENCILPEFGRIGDSKVELLNKLADRLKIVLEDLDKNEKLAFEMDGALESKSVIYKIQQWKRFLTEKNV